MVKAVAVALGAHQLEDTELQTRLVSHLLESSYADSQQGKKKKKKSWLLLSRSLPDATVPRPLVLQLPG